MKSSTKKRAAKEWLILLATVLATVGATLVAQQLWSAYYRLPSRLPAAKTQLEEARATLERHIEEFNEAKAAKQLDDVVIGAEEARKIMSEYRLDVAEREFEAARSGRPPTPLALPETWLLALSLYGAVLLVRLTVWAICMLRS